MLLINFLNSFTSSQQFKNRPLLSFMQEMTLFLAFVIVSLNSGLTTDEFSRNLLLNASILSSEDLTGSFSETSLGVESAVVCFNLAIASASSFRNSSATLS